MSTKKEAHQNISKMYVIKIQIVIKNRVSNLFIIKEKLNVPVKITRKGFI